MLRSARGIFVVAALGTAAFAADDDGVMGVWEGRFTTPEWSGRTISAKIVATGEDTWDATLSVGEAGKSAVRVRMYDRVADKTAEFSGEADLGNDLGGRFDLTAQARDGRMMGRFETRRGQGADFEMQRITVKPPSLGQAPPDGAIVLLDGTNLDAWVPVPEKWSLVEEGAMQVTSPSLKTIQEFGSCQLHLEFRTPFMPNEPPGAQSRGNSGVYVQGRYEVQVLDSFGVEPADNLCGGIYKVAAPAADATLPPLTWQTYDITFRAPKFDASGTKVQDAEITVLHNGILIHDKLKLPHATPGGITDAEGPAGPLLLQHHGDAVRYRNVWLKPIED